MASCSSSSSFYKITLRCSDGKEVEVDSRVAANSATVRRLLERHVDDGPIPLPNIESHVLPKVIEYCYMHADAEADADDQLKAWDVEFTRTADEKDLLDLVVAASYLEIKKLSELVGNKLKALSDEAERQRRRRRRRAAAVCAGCSAMLLVAVILIAALCYVLLS